jgi:catechol 2,3-dioxygenase-like lactoylglutathione lyase family enzyme
MKRFHVHVSVRDLDESTRFYTALFGAEPTVLKDDYAKWMLDDPRVNFAISTRAGAAGIDHLGIQAEDADELAELGARLDQAGQGVLAEQGTACCHARSDKFWTVDPQGTRWETFHTLGTATSYYGNDPATASTLSMAHDAGTAEPSADCCDATTPQGVCCAPKADRPADAPCCGPVVVAVKQAGCAVAGCDDARR